MCSLSLANKPEKRVFSLQVFRKYKKSKIDKTVRDERNLFPPSHCKPWAAPFQSSLQGLCPSVTEHLSRLLKISSATRHTHYQQKTFTQASQQPCSSAWWWRDQRDTVKNCLLSQEAFTACTLQTEQYMYFFPMVVDASWATSINWLGIQTHQPPPVHFTCTLDGNSAALYESLDVYKHRVMKYTMFDRPGATLNISKVISLTVKW